MKKILLIGNGAREHVIGETLKKSRHGVRLFVVGKSKNPGLALLADEYLLAEVTDKETIKDFVLRVKPDFAVLGPEAPIAAGIADMLMEMEIHSASPLQTVGRLESSKSFTRDLLEKYGISGNPKFKVFCSSGHSSPHSSPHSSGHSSPHSSGKNGENSNFKDSDNEKALGEFFDELGENFVVKADGLKSGKGVMVSGDHLHGRKEGLAYALECLADAGCVVVEEKLIGQEFSLMSFCDGRHVADMPIVQDHKRAYEGDKGPNTGGMGSYSCADHCLPFLRQQNVEEAIDITEKVARALFEETGCYFKGVMYGGFMAVKEGVRLIEYNARFGDPEAMNVLPLLKTDFVDICEAIINGNLADLTVEFEKKATVCKYVVPVGYPDNPAKGEKIEIVNLPAGYPASIVKDEKIEISVADGDKDQARATIVAEDFKDGAGDKDQARATIIAEDFKDGAGDGEGRLKIYYAAVDQREDGLYLSGSRAVAMVGIADGLEKAEKIAEAGAKAIKGPVFYRKDIGTQELIEKRVEMMRQLRR